MSVDIKAIVPFITLLIAAITLCRVEDFHDFGKWAFRASLCLVALGAITLFI